MEITLNEKDREYLATRCAEKLQDKIMLTLLSGAGYAHVSNTIKRWVNFSTSESSIRAIIRTEINDVVKREITAMFNQYAPPEKRELVAPIREAIREAALEQIAELALRISPPKVEED